MWTITRRRFRRNRRGISNVIVVVLSLVIILAIVSNIILWNYEMNQQDWEKLKEDVSITNVERVTGSSWIGTKSDYSVNTGVHVTGSYADTQADDGVFERFKEASVLPYSPSGYSLGGSTSLISGSVSDLMSDDEVYMTFRSYSSMTDTSGFVDNDTSDVDSSADKGTHSNFAAEQIGPDSIYDTLTESSGGSGNTTLINAESFEGTWPPLGWSETGNWNRESDQAYDGTFSADFDGQSGKSGVLTTRDIDCSDADTIYLDFWYRDDGSEAGEFVIQYYDGTGWDTVADLGQTSSEYQWLHYQDSTTDSQYFRSDFKIRWSTNTNHNSDDVYVDLVTIKKETDPTNYELDLEVQWANADYNETNEELAIYVGAESNTHSLDATGGYLVVGDGSPDWGSTSGTISFWIKLDTVDDRPWGQHTDMEARFSGSNLVLDWGGTGSLTSSTSFTTGTWYFIAITWDEVSNDLTLYVGDEDSPPTVDASTGSWFSSVSPVGVTENNFMASRGGVTPTNGHGEDLRYYDTDRNFTEIQSDYNTELTGSETNLRSYFELNNDFDDIGPDNNDGSGSGSYSFASDIPFGGSPTENLQVDVWDGVAWENVFAALTNGWNNVSVSSYLTSSTFTIRFKGNTETGDATQDSWNIDATLLQVGSDAHIVEAEFTGSSDAEDWSQLTWLIDSAWTTSSVNVTMQLYNFTLDAYPTSGDGYMNYLSSGTADTDETKSQTITVNPVDFRNATSHWKMKVRGVKATGTSFDFKADLIELSPENYRLDMSGAFVIDTYTNSLEDIQGVELQLRYRADDSAETWYLKAYNWTTDAYSDVGFNSTAGHTPTTGWDYYAVNLTDVWQSYVHSNGTINIQFVDFGADATQTTVDVDFLGTSVKIDGTQITIENDGSFTVHVVSLWISNSTDHQRHDINVFVNSADTKNYLNTDVSLPTASYTVKVVTERGNTAVYSGS